MTSRAGLRRFVPAAAEPAAPAPGAPAPTAQPPAAANSAPPRPAATNPAPPRPAATNPAPPRPAADERCELCAESIPGDHGHVADLEQSSLMCACRACYLLFTSAEAGRGRYRAVPDRYLTDPDHPLTIAEWDTLEIPVGLAFFLRNSRSEVSGHYPSPAGATECRLDLHTWSQLTAAHPLLEAAVPDVEAALISRADGQVECFIVPIDACYELAGRMRLYWRGFDGGEEARRSIGEFLESIRGRARVLGRVG